MTDVPTLTDGTVVVRAWRDGDVEPSVAGQDAEVDHWFGQPGGLTVEHQREVVERWRAEAREGRRISFVVALADDETVPVGNVELRRIDEHQAELSWWLYAGQRGRGSATRAVRVVVDWALTEAAQGGAGYSRVQARVEPENQRSMRVATRSGLRREGVQRVALGTGDRAETEAYVVLARLASDPPLSEPGAFRALLNSFLPRKRAIAQMLVRDESTPEPRVLLCGLTYKQDWDLPGGVVEVGESPHVAVAREVTEELALDIPAGPLLLTDWLPPWGGWDDALCLVFDGGTHPAALLEQVVPQAREIREAAFLTLDEVAERAADFTTRRVAAALARVGAAGDGPGYSESGRPV
ncbi:hypothetical protein GCM10023340_27090 [Nocardioides marinquilinus]|uniref:NUDIX hydrolase n=1 Tax=Nocardioides marinquilinus TaxID=1210400 RepID=A0ABP9PQ65_9ACTN